MRSIAAVANVQTVCKGHGVTGWDFHSRELSRTSNFVLDFALHHLDLSQTNLKREQLVIRCTW